VNVAAEGEGFAFTTTFPGTTLVLGTSQLTGRGVDVYDLGTSGHMSPNRHRLTTFKEIAPRTINATDKTILKAVGVGNMRIGIPNGKTTTYITLRDILYCPDFAFTLISLTGCDAAGFLVLLKDRKCIIEMREGQYLGKSHSWMVYTR
jgi:Pol polyprotein, beta-barrel domain